MDREVQGRTSLFFDVAVNPGDVQYIKCTDEYVNNAAHSDAASALTHKVMLQV